MCPRALASTKIAAEDPRLEDRVADNLNKWEITESETLLFGRNFGIVTDVQTGPDGNLFLVSLTSGVVYEGVPALTGMREGAGLPASAP